MSFAEVTEEPGAQTSGFTYSTPSHFTGPLLENVEAQLNQLVEPILNGLSGGAVGTGRIPCAESKALDGHANKSSDQRIVWRCAHLLAEVQAHLQYRLRGGFIARLPIGTGQVHPVLTQL